MAGIPAVEAQRGLLEALAVQLPERIGVELPDCIDKTETHTVLMRIMAESLSWRDPELITSRTVDLVENAFRVPDLSATLFDAILAIAIHQSPLDAHWLFITLSTRPLPRRDGFWCGFLHKNYEAQGSVRKLLDGAFEVEPTMLSNEQTERWAICLLWFCAAADRRVRDQATKALVHITQAPTTIWVSLIRLFASIDDEYVIERCFVAAYGTLLRTRDAMALRSVSSAVFDVLFAGDNRFQNAAIRDAGRSIMELASHDGVLPEGVAENAYMPPYTSEWPLDIPSRQDVEQYKDSGQDIPRLYYSCLYDGFFTYILSTLEPYTHAISRQEMGRWIFRQVLNMGYTSKWHAGYDGYMITTYGGGRGRPEWAERIGKKYQWIALARLAARLADHITPERSGWKTELQRIPLQYPRGRDTDPSILLRTSPGEKPAAWWMPVVYDFIPTESLPDSEWQTDASDMPDAGTILQTCLDAKGRSWIMLEGHMTWSADKDKDGDEDDVRIYRHVWLQVRSYAVPKEKSQACWRWLKKQQFMGRWMPEGHQLHEGYAGEYPWATMFNLYPEEEHSGRSNKPIPYPFTPTCHSVGIEADSFQVGAIHILVPASLFSNTVPLKWNGLSGYDCLDGRHAFLDPSVVEAGPSALIANPQILTEILEQNGLVLFWTVLGEKLVIGSDAQNPRIEYSRVYTLASEGIRSARPVTGIR